MDKWPVTKLGMIIIWMGYILPKSLNTRFPNNEKTIWYRMPVYILWRVHVVHVTVDMVNITKPHGFQWDADLIIICAYECAGIVWVCVLLVLQSKRILHNTYWYYIRLHYHDPVTLVPQIHRVTIVIQCDQGRSPLLLLWDTQVTWPNDFCCSVNIMVYTCLGEKQIQTMLITLHVHIVRNFEYKPNLSFQDIM